MNFFIPAAYAQGGAQQPPGGEMFQFAFLIGIFVLFYFIAIRPQRKRQKEHQSMLESLSVGDEIATSSGILGKVRKIEDNFVVLKVADNVELRFQKVAISAVLPKGTIKSIG
jgi:preprotein translocase subunit YajC